MQFIDCRFYNELTFEEIELTKSHCEDFNMALDGWEDPDFDFTGAAFLAEPTLGAVELPNGWELSMKSEREGEFVRLRRSLPEEKAARSGEVSEQDD